MRNTPYHDGSGVAELEIHAHCIKCNAALDFGLLALHILFQAGIISHVKILGE
jgi:hypothetical protein